MYTPSNADLMLIEGEPILADLASFRLELLGYQLRVYESLKTAQAAIDAGLPDLLIIDSVMPEGDGIEFVSKLRGMYTPAELPILVFSIDPSLETVERAIAAGAQDYLVTPFDPTVLETKVQSRLAERASLLGRA